MVALSLTISICRRSGHRSSTPSLEYQASVYSSSINPHEPPAYGYHVDRDTSLDQLVTKQRPQGDDQDRCKATTSNAKLRMISKETDFGHLEKRKSFGIGGAGNIRRPSEFIYPARVNADGTRRSSVWSTISVSFLPGATSAARSFSVFSLFRRGSMDAKISSVDGRVRSTSEK
ncbi:uncharacterized protein RSE6_02565 [Rhynchosporium secalis]|uniref:Uncharacterized protein n=1 Tax=Rhynchosporium secalis TaxID=38038 RepID=A0A1E1M0K0_RHYSE|nr:uncharacterized protein RSE6_02565 [Rhynchosporium secalis]